MVLLITIVSCTSQPESVPTNSRVIDAVLVTPTPTNLPQSALTEILIPTAFIVPTPTSYISIKTAYASLPTGEYIVSVEGDSSLRAVSVDSSISALLVENIVGDGFKYNNERLAFTSTFWDSDQEHHQIHVFNFKTGIDSKFQNPARKECMAEDWSLDGKQLIVLCRSIDDYLFFEMALLSVEDGRFVTVMIDEHKEDDSDGGYEQVRLSPNGKWLAYYRLFSKGPELIEGLYITDATCLSEPATCKDKTYRFPMKKLTSDRGNRIINWTSESHLVVALNNQIQVFDVQEQQKIRVLTVTPNVDFIQNMSWSPDGKWVVVRLQDSGDSLLIATQSGKVTQLNVAVTNPFWIVVP